MELGFRRLKQALDEKGVGFKNYIFEIDQERGSEDDIKDANEIRLEIFNETRQAIPLMREEFIQRIDEELLENRELAEKIAVGCQQVGRSPCFIHFWAFHALWLVFNSEKANASKKTMK